MEQPPVDHVFVKTTGSQAAAAARISVGLAGRKLGELTERLRSCFRRIEPFLQARKYVRAVTSELPKRNGWTVAEHVRDRTPDRTQRLLNRAVWDEAAAMAEIRRFAVSGLEEAARKAGRRRGKLVIGALDETGQQKKGDATAGVKRQHLGCAGRVENGINTVHLSYVREGVGHALIGFRQWIPDEQITDPVRSRRMALPVDLTFRTKGQLAIDIATTAATDGFRPDFYCGDEVYGNCTELRSHFEAGAQAYVLRVQKNFRITLPNGAVLSCDQAVKTLLQGLKHKRRWEIRSAGKGSKGERWYAWAWIATHSARHYLLIRKHLRTGELAFHYCYVPEGQLITKARLIRAAGLRWPVEEGFEFGKDCFGLDQAQVRLYTAIARHTVLVCAALAVCAVTAACSATAPTVKPPNPYTPTNSRPPIPA